jgi:hypothetical protein
MGFGVVLCGVDFFGQIGNRKNGMLATQVLVVDQAHHEQRKDALETHGGLNFETEMVSQALKDTYFLPIHITKCHKKLTN